MSADFWRYTIWYILLVISGIILILISVRKSKNNKFTIAFTLALIGFTYIAERLVMVEFNAYKYHPHISTKQYSENIWGNIASQISLASTAMLIIIFKLSNVWYFIFGAIYYFIDILFVKFGLYEHIWYKSIYSGVGFLVYIWIAKKWYYKLIKLPKFYIYYITLFLGTYALSNIFIIALREMGIQFARAFYYPNVNKDAGVGNFIYFFFLRNILINIYRWKLSPVKKGLVFLCLFVVQYLFHKFGILFIKEGWFTIITCLDFFVIYVIIILVDYLLSKGILASNSEIYRKEDQ